MKARFDFTPVSMEVNHASIKVADSAEVAFKSPAGTLVRYKAIIEISIVRTLVVNALG